MSDNNLNAGLLQISKTLRDNTLSINIDQTIAENSRNAITTAQQMTARKNLALPYTTDGKNYSDIITWDGVFGDRATGSYVVSEEERITFAKVGNALNAEQLALNNVDILYSENYTEYSPSNLVEYNIELSNLKLTENIWRNPSTHEVATDLDCLNITLSITDSTWIPLVVNVKVAGTYEMSASADEKMNVTFTDAGLYFIKFPDISNIINGSKVCPLTVSLYIADANLVEEDIISYNNKLDQHLIENGYFTDIVNKTTSVIIFDEEHPEKYHKISPVEGYDFYLVSETPISGNLLSESNTYSISGNIQILYDDAEPANIIANNAQFNFIENDGLYLGLITSDLLGGMSIPCCVYAPSAGTYSEIEVDRAGLYLLRYQMIYSNNLFNLKNNDSNSAHGFAVYPNKLDFGNYAITKIDTEDISGIPYKFIKNANLEKVSRIDFVDPELECPHIEHDDLNYNYYQIGYNTQLFADDFSGLKITFNRNYQNYEVTSFTFTEAGQYLSIFSEAPVGLNTSYTPLIVVIRNSKNDIMSGINPGVYLNANAWGSSWNLMSVEADNPIFEIAHKINDNFINRNIKVSYKKENSDENKVSYSISTSYAQMMYDYLQGITPIVVDDISGSQVENAARVYKTYQLAKVYANKFIFISISDKCIDSFEYSSSGVSSTDSIYLQEELYAGTGISISDNTISATELFWCTYDTTTFTEIQNALSVGRLPVVYYNNTLAIYSHLYNNSVYVFTGVDDLMKGAIPGFSLIKVECDSSNTWSHDAHNVEDLDNKIQQITSETATVDNYPSAYAVYNYHDESKQDVLTAGNGITINGSTISANELFTCTYGTTTFDEITSALDEGKLPIVYANGSLAIYTTSTGSESHNFTSIAEPVRVNESYPNVYINIVKCDSENNWTITGSFIQTKDYLRQSISASFAQNQNNYPSVYAVYNYHDESKQDAISDLATIRSGASLGATALQSVPSTYRTAAEQDAIHDSTKQDVISDLTDIRSGAAAGATAVQPVTSTINVTTATIGTLYANSVRVPTYYYVTSESALPTEGVSTGDIGIIYS